MHQCNQSHAQQGKHREVERGVDQDRPKYNSAGIGGGVSEENHLTEQARSLERMPGYGIEEEEPQSDSEAADDSYIGALRPYRVGVIQHAEPPEESPARDAARDRFFTLGLESSERKQMELPPGNSRRMGRRLHLGPKRGLVKRTSEPRVPPPEQERHGAECQDAAPNGGGPGQPLPGEIRQHEQVAQEQE